LFRQKVSFPHTPKTNPIKNSNKGNKETNKLANIERLPPSILAKFSKEVNKISKYFKTQKLLLTKTNSRMSYAQASKPISNIEEVLKIKEVFPSLKAKRTDNIQKIIKGNGKSKLCINMTMEGLSRKQVIVFMNNNNKNNFMEENSSHVTNMNSTLKNIKSEVMVDFVQVDPKSIIIVTNKVTSTLDLQTIENYVKNVNCINTEKVKVSRLP